MLEFISVGQSTRIHNAADLASKAMRSDPFIYARTLTELRLGCHNQGGSHHVATDAGHMIATRVRNRKGESIEPTARAIKLHLGMEV